MSRQIFRGKIGLAGRGGYSFVGSTMAYTAGTGLTLSGNQFSLTDPVSVSAYKLNGNPALTEILSNTYTALYAPDGSTTTNGIFVGNSGNDNIFLRKGTTSIQDATGANTFLSASSGGVSLLGTNTNNNAAAGFVGEVISANVPSGSAISLGGSLVVTNVTSISLTAGDWDVEGNVQFNANGATVAGYIASSSSTSATLASFYNELDVGGNIGFNIPVARYSLNATTTIYLVAEANYSVATPKVFGQIRGRRMR